MQNNKSGFTTLELLLSLFIVVLVIGAGLYTWRHTNKSHAVATTSVQNGEVKLYGKITKDSCFTNGTANNDGGHGAPIGDVGCSITVNGYSIDVRQGNIGPPKNPGTVTGLNFNQNQEGHYASVYAQKIDNQSASIWSDSKYYVKIY